MISRHFMNINTIKNIENISKVRLFPSELQMREAIFQSSTQE